MVKQWAKWTMDPRHVHPMWFLSTTGEDQTDWEGHTQISGQIRHPVTVTCWYPGHPRACHPTTIQSMPSADTCSYPAARGPQRLSDQRDKDNSIFTRDALQTTDLKSPPTHTHTQKCEMYMYIVSCGTFGFSVYIWNGTEGKNERKWTFEKKKRKKCSYCITFLS